LPTNLENVFYNNTSVRTDVGCTIEYNMNSMIDGIAASTTATDANYISGVTSAAGTTIRLNPFKKLFPVDSVIKPFRPSGPGIKYFIALPSDTTTFSAFRTLQYPNTQPRVYYPGISTTYKYWVAPKNAAADLTVTYKQASNPVTGNKNAVANKIIVKFDKYNQLPTTYTITITKSDNSTQVLGPTSTPASGLVTLYYGGSSWSATAPTEPITYATPQAIKSIRVQATNPGSGKVIAIIEVSARWIKDISSDIVSLDITKESSSNPSDILPVGIVTANNIDLNLSKYNQTALQTLSYNRLSESFDTDKTYMFKYAELKPYIKVFHSDGAITSGSDKYDRVEQGIYYIDNWSISEYGDVRVVALDGAKYLMETFCPDILCEDYPVTAILRRLLDSIGFTDYNFNLKSPDTSVPLINYWWTEDSQTVWEAIQILCRDIQMNAFFDDEGILQFYSRDYIYDSARSSAWSFYSEAEGSALPNIISFSQDEIASGNQVKIIWKTPLKSNYVQSSGPLWESPTTFLSAGGLKYSIAADTTVADLNNLTNATTYPGLQIETKTVDNYSQYQSIFNFNGYLLIDSEIFEFDALQYQYVAKEDSSATPTWIPVWIESQSDVSKYRYLSKPGFQDPTRPESAYFKPTNRVRVKSRGSLGTTAAFHSATASDSLNQWTGRTITWTTGGSK
jgi:hypothetical protein